MKKFKLKNYTIPEGHYTGPQQATTDSWGKALNESGLIGAGLGGLTNYMNDEDAGKSTVQKVIEGAGKGYLYGLVSGAALKGLTEYIHSPLKDIDFQRLDKNIRAQFGSFKIPFLQKQVDLEEDNPRKLKDKITYNSRNITDYKLNFGIRRNQIVMYTFGVSNDELDKLSQILDDMVMNQPNMNYHSSLINKSQNSYAVAITFTAYEIAAKYIVAAADVVSGKINLMDKDYLISKRVNEFNVDKLEDPDVKQGIDTESRSITEKFDDSEKTFSLTGDEKYSAIEFLRNDGVQSIVDITKSIKTKKMGSTASNHLIRLINHAVNRTIEKGKIKVGMPVKREELNTGYLVDLLKKLHYVKGFNFTEDKANGGCNLSLVSGILVVTVDKGDKSELVDKEFYSNGKDRIRRAEIDSVVSYVYSVSSKSDLEFLLKKLFSTKLKINVIP